MNKTNRNYSSTLKLFIASLFWILLICIGCTKLDSPDEDGVDSKEVSGSTANDSSPPTFAFLPPNHAGGENFDSATDLASEHDGESNTLDGGSRDGEIVDGSADSSKKQRYCDEEGALRCVANASGARQVCKNGIWQNADSCDNNPAVCNSEGQNWDIGSCSEAYPYCVGQGVCKKCGTDAHCEPAPDCMLAICTDVGCKYINNSDAFGEDCNNGQGYCNATGECLECLQGDHCSSPTPVCSHGVCIACNASYGCNTGVCKTSALDPTQNKCVECMGPEDCPFRWACNLSTNECQEPSTPCGNGVLEGGEQCDDGEQIAPSVNAWGVISNYDGCGPNCQIHWTWGCPLLHKSQSDLGTYLKRELEDNIPSVATWVWSLPSDGSQTGPAGLTIGELSTCARPCHPVRRLADGSNFGYCDNASGEPVAHTIPGSGEYEVTCMNGACVIPCRGASKSCPAGYECADENHKVLLMQQWLDSDGAVEKYEHFDYCVAQEIGTPPFEYAD